MRLKSRPKRIAISLEINNIVYSSLPELKNNFPFIADEKGECDRSCLCKYLPTLKRWLGQHSNSQEYNAIKRIGACVDSNDIVKILFSEDLDPNMQGLGWSEMIPYAIYKKYPKSGINILAYYIKANGWAIENIQNALRYNGFSKTDIEKLEELIGVFPKNSAPISDDPFLKRPLYQSVGHEQVQANKISFYQKTSSRLRELLDINSPIICIQESDFVRVDEIISNAVGDNHIINEWNPGTGSTNFVNKTRIGGSDDIVDLDKFLSGFIKESHDKRVLVLKDVHWYFDANSNQSINKESIISLIRTIAQKKLYDSKYNVSLIILTSASFTMPRELAPYISYLDIPNPDEVEIRNMINEHVEVNDAEFNKDDEDSIVHSLKGLSAFEIDRALDMAIGRNGALSAKDTDLLNSQKKELIKKSGVLELIEAKGTIEDIGGLDHLKKYLKQKAKIMLNPQPAEKYGITIPKGIMVVGMPGCGKSMIAKAASMLFDNIPLLKMDMGNLQGRYVGESESNMRMAIKMSESAAPCILWIDEIEKAFAGIGSGNEAYTTRMFGFFLSWMQDKKSQVYIIATANKINDLPPELKRKGRFDEIFCVDLPNDVEREKIFNAQLSSKKRGRPTLDNFPSHKKAKLIELTKGFNGADINSIIDNSLEELFVEGVDASNNDELIAKMIKVAEKAIGIERSFADQIKLMREEFGKNSFIDANSGKKIEPQNNK